ncbi:UNKNOWN [Stylonychia lemnae]|uniref:Uncharacterized protein n=1 Tax=Stylonychia lemnae TaxID=5949 RepID=A0A078BCJ9_STYLE|nr:UNKNOWN [Stylonychia lemnae]|eukprot:CDW91333.1 UNKNOWN [Stylonychia lemnae]
MFSEDSIFGRRSQRSYGITMRPVITSMSKDEENSKTGDQGKMINRANSTASLRARSQYGLQSYLARMRQSKLQRLKQKLNIKDIEAYLKSSYGCLEVEQFLCEEIGEYEFYRQLEQLQNQIKKSNLNQEERDLIQKRLFYVPKNGVSDRRKDKVKQEKQALKTTEVPIFLNLKKLLNNKDNDLITSDSSRPYTSYNRRIILQNPVLNYQSFGILKSAQRTFDTQDQMKSHESSRKPSPQREQLVIPTQTLELKFKKKRPRIIIGSNTQINTMFNKPQTPSVYYERGNSLNGRQFIHKSQKSFQSTQKLHAQSDLQSPKEIFERTEKKKLEQLNEIIDKIVSPDKNQNKIIQGLSHLESHKAYKSKNGKISSHFLSKVKSTQNAHDIIKNKNQPVNFLNLQMQPLRKNVVQPSK